MTPEPPAANEPHLLETSRRDNREAVRALGLEPYGSSTTGILTAEDARAQWNADADKAQQERGKEPGFADTRALVTVSGRVMLRRDNGKLVWMTLRDHTGDIQVAASQRDCDDAGFKLAKLTDLSDLVIATGRVMKTKTGETTLWASSMLPAAKSLAPPPEKHAGLADVEIRYRQRYVDLWANPQTMRVFTLRSKIVSRVREFLVGRGFLEVETPMLQPQAGGAAARPFVTTMNALSMNLFMRIAPELYLKRLLVGGMPRVFEINRNFRNEGLDKQHNPEFTMLEVYEAFGDCASVMALTEDVVRDAALFVAAQPEYRALTPVTDAEGGGRLSVLPFGEFEIDYGRPFLRVSYAQLFEKALGFSMGDIPRARRTAAERHVLSKEASEKLDPVLVVNDLFEEFAEKSVDPSRPTFITHYPAALSPLTRANREDPAVADRADLFIGGMEIAPHYTELNDPDVQESRFREQLAGLDAEKAAEENTYRTLDLDFIRALKVGMPPAGGLGLGIDRLTMLLTNQRTIRDVVLFPLMRAEE